MDPRPTDAMRATEPLPTDGRAALLSLAQALQRQGIEVDVQGTVVTRSIAGSVVLHALVAAGSGLLWMAAPLVGAAVTFAVAWSAYVELEGGRGWLRAFVPRGVGHNLIVWGAPGPKRQLVVCAPLDGPHRSLWADARWYLPVLAGLAVTAVGMAVSFVSATVATQIVGASTAALLALALVATVGILVYDPGTEPLGAELLALAGRLRAAPTSNVSVTVAATQGGSLTHDGLDILVRNNHHRLPPRSTRVVVLAPASGAPRLVDPEGLWRRTMADPLLAGAVRSLGVDARGGVSAASRLARARITAIGVVGEVDTDWIESMVRALDAASLRVIEKPGAEPGA